MESPVANEALRRSYPRRRAGNRRSVGGDRADSRELPHATEPPLPRLHPEVQSRPESDANGCQSQRLEGLRLRTGPLPRAGAGPGRTDRTHAGPSSDADTDDADSACTPDG